MSARSGLWLVIFGAVGCGQAVTAHRVEGRPNAYEIECLQAAHCTAKAREVCGRTFDVVAEWEHPIILPDARPTQRDYPRLAAQQVSSWEAYSSHTGPSDAATAPPLHRLDVVCRN
jgi:hypothetical protein